MHLRGSQMVQHMGSFRGFGQRFNYCQLLSIEKSYGHASINMAAKYVSFSLHLIEMKQQLFLYKSLQSGKVSWQLKQTVKLKYLWFRILFLTCSIPCSLCEFFSPSALNHIPVNVYLETPQTTAGLGHGRQKKKLIQRITNFSASWQGHSCLREKRRLHIYLEEGK